MCMFSLQGTVFPAYHTLFSLWAPPMERSFLVGLTLAGEKPSTVEFALCLFFHKNHANMSMPTRPLL